MAFSMWRLFQQVNFLILSNAKTTNAYAFLMVSLSIVGRGRNSEKATYIISY
jgi:hypothetical protein